MDGRAALAMTGFRRDTLYEKSYVHGKGWPR